MFWVIAHNTVNVSFTNGLYASAAADVAAIDALPRF